MHPTMRSFCVALLLGLVVCCSGEMARPLTMLATSSSSSSTPTYEQQIPPNAQKVVYQLPGQAPQVGYAVPVSSTTTTQTATTPQVAVPASPITIPVALIPQSPSDAAQASGSTNSPIQTITLVPAPSSSSSSGDTVVVDKYTYAQQLPPSNPSSSSPSSSSLQAAAGEPIGYVSASSSSRSTPTSSSYPSPSSPSSSYSDYNTSSSKEEGGNGWRVLFIVTMLIIGYIGIGCWYNRKTDGLKGMQAFPHIEFWLSVPGYVRDGCIFSKKWLSASWARGYPLRFDQVEGSGEYQAISQARKPEFAASV